MGQRAAGLVIGLGALMTAADLGRRGLAIEPGWIVLTGGLTDAVPAGTVLAAHFTHRGSMFLP